MNTFRADIEDTGFKELINRRLILNVNVYFIKDDSEILCSYLYCPQCILMHLINVFAFVCVVFSVWFLNFEPSTLVKWGYCSLVCLSECK